MSGIFPVLIGIALAAVLGALTVGVISMLKGGDFNRRNANRLMRLRVGLQFCALVLLGLAFLFRGS